MDFALQIPTVAMLMPLVAVGLCVYLVGSAAVQFLIPVGRRQAWRKRWLKIVMVLSVLTLWFVYAAMSDRTSKSENERAMQSVVAQLKATSVSGDFMKHEKALFSAQTGKDPAIQAFKTDLAKVFPDVSFQIGTSRGQQREIAFFCSPGKSVPAELLSELKANIPQRWKIGTGSEGKAPKSDDDLVTEKSCDYALFVQGYTLH